MRAIVIILAAGVTPFLFTNCKDIGEIAPEMEKMEPVVRNLPSIYPFERKLTDIEGRSIDAEILGKQKLQIAISKLSSTRNFIISMDRLSEVDQEYFSSLRDGGKFDKIKSQLDQEARLSGRVARWHMDVSSAEREASKLNLPMLLAITVNGNEESSNLEEKLGFSTEFREWSNMNLVLCMLKVDDPESNRTTSFSAVENRSNAARYGVTNYSGPTVLLVKPDRSLRMVLSNAAVSSPDTAISEVSSALDKSLGWGAIVAREAPQKKRASVNGGAVFSSGSS